MREEFQHVPWLPLSVILPPGKSVSGIEGRADKSGSGDGEANLNALLGTLGPSKGKRPSTPLGEAMGGTVGSVRLDDVGADKKNGGSVKQPTIQLQRVAPRCHCQVIYVTYGDQVEAEISRSASPGNISVSGEGAGSSGVMIIVTFHSLVLVL